MSSKDGVKIAIQFSLRQTAHCSSSTLLPLPTLLLRVQVLAVSAPLSVHIPVCPPRLLQGRKDAELPHEHRGLSSCTSQSLKPTKVRGLVEHVGHGAHIHPLCILLSGLLPLQMPSSTEEGLAAL